MNNVNEQLETEKNLRSGWQGNLGYQGTSRRWFRGCKLGHI